jgi:hypothetical protein
MLLSPSVRSRRPYFASGGDFLAVATSRDLIRRLPRYLFSHRTGVPGDFPSWLAYLFWNKGIAAIGATRGEIYTHIIPLSGGILSILFLHTQPHLYHLLSMLLILTGIAICSLAKNSGTVINKNQQLTHI